MKIETGIVRLTADPELRLVNGKNGEVAVVTFNVAKTMGFGDNQKPLFIQVDFWGKRAEVIKNHFVKGSRIVISGELDFDQWEKDGQKFSKHKIRGLDFEFVDSKADAEKLAADGESKSTETSKASEAEDDENPFAE